MLARTTPRLRSFSITPAEPPDLERVLALQVQLFFPASARSRRESPKAPTPSEADNPSTSVHSSNPAGRWPTARLQDLYPATKRIDLPPGSIKQRARQHLKAPFLQWSWGRSGMMLRSRA